MIYKLIPLRSAQSGRRRARSLSAVERGVAMSLALVWLLGGAFALYLALANSRWGVAIGGLAALVCGAIWLRVAVCSRLLAWQDLIAPWRHV
jgi:hypothetical protein